MALSPSILYSGPMMTKAEIEALAALDRAATSGPWYVRHLDDDHAMSAVGIATTPDTDRHEDMATFYAPGPELLAATLIQAPPYVVSSDRLWQQNAELIVALRNALPDLLALARAQLSETE